MLFKTALFDVCDPRLCVVTKHETVYPLFVTLPDDKAHTVALGDVDESGGDYFCFAYNLSDDGILFGIAWDDYEAFLSAHNVQKDGDGIFNDDGRLGDALFERFKAFVMDSAFN